MRTIAISLFVALCTAAPNLYAQFTMGGLGTSMGIMGGLQGMGSQSMGIGMGAVNGLQGTMGQTGGMMGGMTPGMGGMGMGGMNQMGGMGGYGDVDGELNPGFVTGSLDGKPVAPLLPNMTEWAHESDIATTWWQTGYWQGYDDHVMIARFTPRAHDFTDNEVVWLVHPDAVEGRDYDPDNVKALWYVTFLEDLWIVENNHIGIKCESE